MNNNKTITILTITNKKRSDEGYELLKKEKAKIDFLNPKIVLIDDCESYAEYNKRCVAKLSEYFDTDFCLIVQFDGKILNPKAWTNDFFNYDYIGAPWASFEMLEYHQEKDTNNKNFLVGNGGFSLRSKQLCEKLKEVANKYNGEPEDVFICQIMRSFLENNNIRFAPFEIAKLFSVENQQYLNQFGAHNNIVINKNNILRYVSVKQF